jgi:DNA invertase Pin-like site-specific DNA recombinase
MQRKPPGQTVAYVGVSSPDQSLARQLDIVRAAEPDKIYDEKQSGASREGRKALAEMIGYVREGDTVVVASMDRMARSVVDLNQIVKELVGKGVVVSFLKEGISFRPGDSDPYAEFQLNIMAGIAQLERAIARERQADQIRAARARGAYKGRARALDAKQLAEAAASSPRASTRPPSPDTSASTARRCTAPRSEGTEGVQRSGQSYDSCAAAPEVG